MAFERVTDRADTLKPGDWTFYDGYRPVKNIRIYPRKKQVRITAADGSAKTVLCSQPIVRRPAENV